MRFDEDDFGGLTRFDEKSGNGLGVSAKADPKQITPKMREVDKKLRIFIARLTDFSLFVGNLSQKL